jgi:membrane dipeptidase
LNNIITGIRKAAVLAAGIAALGALGAAAAGAAAAGAPAGAVATDNTQARLDRILTATPLIDGHNDLPWELRTRTKGHLRSIDLTSDTSKIPPPADGAALMTDIPRLRAGRVGGQFWSVWIPAETRGPEAVQMTLEQIDLVKRLTALYPADLEMAYTAADVRRIHRAHRIASLIGIEGGHQINNSLAVLRQMYDLGARYMTLTHTLTTDWADSATDAPRHQGLTPFGIEVIHEMNRLGMLIDLSHVSPETMQAALQQSAAPVIYSHSSARAVVDHPRNVPDDVLKLVAAKGGVVMVNFAPGYVSDEVRHWDADRAAEKARYNAPPFGGLYIGQPERASAALAAWDAAHPAPHATLAQVADHAEHIRQVAGIDHVGLGSDFDGIPNTPAGLDGVDKFPALLAELMRRGWSDADIGKIAGENVLRVLSEAEKVAARLRTERGASEAVADSAGAAH